MAEGKYFAEPGKKISLKLRPFPCLLSQQNLLSLAASEKYAAMQSIELVVAAASEEHAATQSIELVFIKLVIIAFISLFIPATAFSFFRFRLRKKEAEFDRVLNVMGISHEERDKHVPTVRSEYIPSDYIMPVLFCFMVVTLTMSLLLFGGWMVNLGSGMNNNLLLAGVDFIEGGEKAFLRERESMLVITISLMGAYIWSAQNIIRRLITADLSPGTYYNAGIRMIMAALIALMVSFIIPTNYLKNYMLVASFLIGMFPERGLRYLLERVKFMSEKTENQSHPLPLEMIEGISMFHRVRLAEVGIDNAQNLAETNVILLLIQTPFNARKLIDWAVQSKLAVFMKGDLFELQKRGVRTVFDLMVLGKEEGFLERLSKETGVSLLKLENVYNLVREDNGLQKLYRFQERLNALDEYNPGI